MADVEANEASFASTFDAPGLEGPACLCGRVVAGLCCNEGCAWSDFEAEPEGFACEGGRTLLFFAPSSCSALRFSTYASAFRSRIYRITHLVTEWPVPTASGCPACASWVWLAAAPAPTSPLVRPSTGTAGGRFVCEGRPVAFLLPAACLMTSPWQGSEWRPVDRVVVAGGPGRRAR